MSTVCLCHPNLNVIAELVVDCLWSEASFENFVNQLEHYHKLDGSAPEKSLFNLCRTNRSWALPARLVLRKRIVIMGLRRALLLLKQTRTGEVLDMNSNPIFAPQPWVTEFYFSCNVKLRRQKLDLDVEQQLVRLLQACPNIQLLYLRTEHRCGLLSFKTFVTQLGTLEQLRVLRLRHVRLEYQQTPHLESLCAILPKLCRLEKLSVDGWGPDRYYSGHDGKEWTENPPPETLKSLSIQYETFDRDNAKAFVTLFRPTRSYSPTTLTLSLSKSTRQTLLLYDSSAHQARNISFFDCLRDLLPSILNLHILDYCRVNPSLIHTLRLCHSLQKLYITVNEGPSGESDWIHILASLLVNPFKNFLVPYYPQSHRGLVTYYPKSLRELRIHFLRAAIFRQHMHNPDARIATQLHTFPNLKKFVISASRMTTNVKLHPPLLNWDAFPATRAYCEAEGIEFEIVVSCPPPQL